MQITAGINNYVLRPDVSTITHRERIITYRTLIDYHRSLIHKYIIPYMTTCKYQSRKYTTGRANLKLDTSLVVLWMELNYSVFIVDLFSIPNPACPTAFK